MTVPASTLVQLVREVVAAGAPDRGLAADGVTDLVGALEPRQAHTLAQVLMWLALEEQDGVALESQLNALAELAAQDLLPEDVAAQVREIPRARLEGSSVEHHEYLASLTEPPDSPAP